jgi:hypothetical protein
MAAKDRYESLTRLSGIVIAFLWIDIVLQALYALSSLAVIGYIGALQSGRVTVTDPEALAPSEIIQALIAIPATLVSLLLIVLIARWIFRAAWNVRHLGARRLEFSPGWSVGWYFVPFANLVLPFRAMKEIWHASHDPHRWQPGSVGLLSLWWALWISSNILGNINFRLALNAETLEWLRVSEWIGIGVCVLSIPLALVFVRIARRVREAQDRSFASAAEPPPLPEPPETAVAV